MTLPTGALNMQQVQAELVISSPPPTLDRMDMRALALAPLVSGGPLQMSGMRGRTCSNHVMSVGNAFAQPGFVATVQGAINPTQFRGVDIIEVYYPNSALFEVALLNTGIPNDYFTHMMVWPDQNVNQPPLMVLPASAATVFNQGTSLGVAKFWNWNSGVIFPSWGNGWNVRVQFLYGP